MRTSLASLTLPLCLCFAGPALSLTIDNFEQGNFNVVDVAPGPTLGQQTGLAPNAIGGVRLVRANATNGGTTTVSLTTTAGPDGAVATFADAVAPLGQGDVAFIYDGIADGAVNGALNVDLSAFVSIDILAAATPGMATLQVTLWDAAGSEAATPVPIVNGVNSILLANFGLINLTDVNTIRVSVLGLDPFDVVEIQDVSAVPEPGTAFLLGIGMVGLALRKSGMR